MNKYQTDQRQKLLQLFQNSGHDYFSALDIFNSLNSEDISMSAIYRNIKDMENEGVICKVNEKGRQEALYHYVNPESCLGVVHLKCEKCKNTYHLNRHISNMITCIAKDVFNFSLNNAGAFLYGVCDKCV